jgi:hypothetical protein
LFSQFWAVWKGIFDFILENLPEDIKLRAKKEVGASSSLPAYFCSIFLFTRNPGNFSYKRFVF